MSSLLTRWPALLRLAGVLLLIAGLQAWAFNRQTTPLFADAHQQLASLQDEASGNRLLNQSLQNLENYWKTVDDDLNRRQVLELRDSVLEGFHADPAAAVTEFARVVNGFEARSGADQETLAALQRNSLRLDRMYADNFAAAIDAVSSPAWYLQPTASFLSNDRSRNRSLSFNHALYLMHVRDTARAVEILDELRRDAEKDPLKAKALFVLSRLQYEAFQIEKDPAYFQEALQYAQRSVTSNADHALAKLFLDYLLSVDRQAVEVDVSPLEGEGTGEGEGERGAIVNDPGEF